MLGRRQFLAGMAITSIGAAASCARSSDQEEPLPRTIGGRALTPQDLEDALTGSSYLGCGGGGSLAEARELIAADLAAGRTFSMIGVDKLGDSDRVACPYGLASLAPISDAMQDKLDSIDGRLAFPVLDSFRHLEDHLGTKFSGVIMGEIGPLSLAEGLSIAARLGVPALDADTVGRAVPEINQHSVRVAGLPLTPAAGVTPFGDRIVLDSVLDPSREEDVFRAISVVSREIGVTDAPITGAQAKSPNVLVTESVSLAIAIGRAVREAKEAGTDPIEAARGAGDGYQLFRGRIATSTWRDEDGFLQGEVFIDGTGDDAGSRLRLDYKNEHLVAERNGRVIATCPDLITLIDAETFDGINNPDFGDGQNVAVLGFRADPIWRTNAGLEVFSPRYFGYDLDYVPIERRLGG